MIKQILNYQNILDEFNRTGFISKRLKMTAVGDEILLQDAEALRNDMRRGFLTGKVQSKFITFKGGGWH